MFSNVKYIMTDQMYVYTKKINLLHTACITLFIITYQLPSLLYMWECICHTVDVSKIDW